MLFAKKRLQANIFFNGGRYLLFEVLVGVIGNSAGQFDCKKSVRL